MPDITVTSLTPMNGTIEVKVFQQLGTVVFFLTLNRGEFQA
jgi:hypothetical protein